MNVHSGSDMEVYTVTGKQEKQNKEQTHISSEWKTETELTDYGEHNTGSKDDFNVERDNNNLENYDDVSSYDYGESVNEQDNATWNKHEQYSNINRYTEETGWNDWNHVDNRNNEIIPALKQITFTDVKKMVYELVNGLSVLKKLGKTDEEIQRMVEEEVKHYQADIIYQSQDEIDEAENYSFIDCIADDIQRFKVVIENPIVAAIIKFPVTSKQISILYDSLMQMIAKTSTPTKDEQQSETTEREEIEQLVEKISHLENIVEHLQDEIQNILVAIRNEISPESIIQDLESFKDALKMDLIDNLNKEIEYLKEKITEIDTIYSQHEDEQETIVNFINEKLSEFEEKLRESRGDIPDIVWQKLQEQLERMREELEYTLETKLENKIESKIQYSKPGSGTGYSKKEEMEEEQEEEEPVSDEEETEVEESKVVEVQNDTQPVQVETKSSLMDMLKDPKKLPYVIGGGAVIGFIIAKIFHVHI